MASRAPVRTAAVKAAVTRLGFMADAFTHVVFLRGMNVGGHRLTNDALVAAFAALGLEQAAAYQASGNVMVAAASPPDVALIEAGLEAELGYQVPTMVRSVTEVTELAAATPFTAEELAQRPNAKQQVIILAEPSPSDLSGLVAGLPDLLVADGAHVHWLPEGGISTSELDLSAVGRVVGTNTVRTMGTIQRIAKKLA